MIDALKDFPDKLRKAAASPARPDLFYLDHSSPRLSKHKSDLFHSLVMKLMWVSQRCRLDVATTIAFLSTRVLQPTEQDWFKLKRVLEFLNGTVQDKLTLGAESLDCLLNFVDVTFAVHSDMRSHFDGAASFGRGVFMPLSRKQHLNKGSSTEGEIVGVSDYAPNTSWLLKFLLAQGYKPKMTILYQDNESAIKLLKHGKKSSSRRTRHIDIRLFNIKDKLREEGIEVAYCPTQKMVADIFTKPLQGSQFRFFTTHRPGHGPNLVSRSSNSCRPLHEGACWRSWKTWHARVPSFHGQGGRTSATKNACSCRHRELTTAASRTRCTSPCSACSFCSFLSNCRVRTGSLFSSTITV